MTRTVRWLIVVASLLMASAYVLPLWRIALIAPQYPEGLGMRIRIDNIVGVKENDLASINGLNHYIGMKRIEPDAIPELKVMPVILGVLIAAGLGVAALGRRWPLAAWAVTLVACGAAGLYDYWKWGYDYGHNLAEDAIIKIPGMSYQPPLLGPKQLLNFTATSWPDSGGLALVVAGLIVAVALWLAFRRPARAATAVSPAGTST